MKIRTNYQEFKKYCQILHPAGHNYFACYHTDGGAPIQKKDFQPSEQVYQELLDMNNDGYDIYTVVQPSTGFKDSDVKGNRFYIADWDAGRDDEGNYYNDEVVAELKSAKLMQWQNAISSGEMLQPTLIVETRNGFHLYWQVKGSETVYWNGDIESDFDDGEGKNIAADIYRATTLSISKHLRTDSTIMNPARVLRVPGFMWRKSVEGLNPFLTHMVSHKTDKTYSAREIVEAYPLDDECKALATSSRSTRRQHSGTANIYNSPVSAGTWYVVHTGNSEVLEVNAFYEGHQLHAGCTIGNDPKGHDIVIRPGNWMYCNACKCGGFATSDRDELYSVKRETNWQNIKSANTYDELTSDEIQQITEWLAYKGDDRTSEQWFNSRNNIIDETEPDEYISSDDASHSFVDIPQKDDSSELVPAETEIEQQKPDDITVPAIISTDNIDDVLDRHYAENYQFHRSCMPNIITMYASNISMQKGQPFELIAPGLLAVMSGAMGTKHKIQLDESWQQPPIIWMINLAPTGMKKTTIFDCIWAIAKEVESSLYKANSLNDKMYLKALAQFNKNPEKTNPPTRPRNRMLRISDITYQWLGTLLADNPCGTIASSDEILGFLTCTGGKKEDQFARDFMLNSYDGGHYNLCRKTDGVTRVIHNHIGVFGFTHPLKYTQQFYNEREDYVSDGFLPRLLVSCPLEQPMRKQNIKTDTIALDKLKGIYEDLINEPANYSDSTKMQVIPFIHNLTGSAKKYWADSEAKHEDLTIKYFYNQNHWFRPWWNKIQGQVGRLALIIHTIRHRAGEAGRDIDEQSFEMAYSLGHYYLGNAYRLGLKTRHGDIDESIEYRKELMRIKRWTRKYKEPMPIRIMIRNKIFGNSKDANIAIDYWVNNSLGGRIEAIVDKKATQTFMPF